MAGPSYEALVVGAGFAGATAARALAERGRRVLVVDRRGHVAGSAYDERDDAGITVHRYGPHIFHTREKRAWDFLSRFTEWRYYQHRVLGFIQGRLVPLPVNLDTVNELFGLRLDADGLEAFLARRRVPVAEVRSLRDAVVSQIGEELYDLVFRHYSAKQWGVDGGELPASIAARVMSRSSRDGRYFLDRYQGMPRRGYTPLFQAMLAHPRITVALDADYRDVPADWRGLPTWYTGGIDEFFGHAHGALPYRSLRFEVRTLEEEWHQPAAVVNYPNDYDFTRITEFKHWTDERPPRTTVMYEYPAAEGDPYYPMPTAEARALYARYAADAEKTPQVTFLGRLGTYRYLNMDQVVLQALDAVL